MRINNELLRLILIEIEDKSNGADLVDVEIEGYNPEVISYHIGNLVERGFVKAFCGNYAEEKVWGPTDITEEGRKYLDFPSKQYERR